MTTAAPPRPPTTPSRKDLAALIEAARRRRRRRRLRLALVIGALVGAAVAAYYGISVTTSQHPPATTAPSRLPAHALRFQLRGFGTPLPSAVGSGPCPHGRTQIAIYSDAGVRIGTARVCVLMISKFDLPHWGVRRIVQTVREVDSLPGGTILSRQQQTFLFARDQRHTRAIFDGDVVGGSGRFAHRRGTLSGGGAGLDGKAEWLVTLKLS